MNNFKYIVACVLLFTSESRATDASEQDGKVFLEDILLFYGKNNSISTDNLQNFLLLVSARRSELIVHDENPLVNSKV